MESTLREEGPVTDLVSLTVLPWDSRFCGQSHDEAQKSHGKQIHKSMEYVVGT